MTIRRVKSIFGIPLSRVKAEISSALGQSGEISISPFLLEGWSSLNLQGDVDGHPSFVVKFPRALGHEDFSELYKVHQVLAQENICPRPLCLGSIKGTRTIPFLVIEFVHGQSYQSPFDISQHNFDLLVATLDRLASIALPTVPAYDTPIAFLESFVNPIEATISNSRNTLAASSVSRMRDFELVAKTSRRYLEGMDWVPALVHGDLYERNMVFQSDRVVLLDWEECCTADRFYDRAYLFVQPFDYRPLPNNHYARKGCPDCHWKNLELLCLLRVTAWSIQRLFDSEARLIETSLTGLSSDSLVQEYIRRKLSLLSDILED
jgi:aminoglycoside phosphotransferase (APT) family kinase protein